MSKKKVLINERFKDVYNPKKIYKPGDTEVMTVERITEIKSVNPNFVTVIGEVEEPPVKEPPATPPAEGKDDGKGEGKDDGKKK